MKMAGLRAFLVCRRHWPLSPTEFRAAVAAWWWLRTRRIRTRLNPDFMWHCYTGEFSPSAEVEELCRVCDATHDEHSPADWCPHSCFDCE